MAISLTFLYSTNDTFKICLSMLSFFSYKYYNKINFTQFILFTSHNCSTDIFTNAHFGYRHFSGLLVFQTAFVANFQSVEIDKFSNYYQIANYSHFVWHVNVYSFLLTNITSFWTIFLLNRKFNSKQAFIPCFQSIKQF